ncbi:MAG: hypothetical protein GC155_16330 [Alphaproteobacteria bacterium]|nr:hypothetical protein [Alphaproteobacteria bacterium]
MGISQRIFENVGFFGVQEESKDGLKVTQWRGTCFFIEEAACEDPSKIWGYMVTARHVAEKIAYREAFLRLNKVGGGSEVIAIPARSVRWWLHPTDCTVDVAVARWLPPEDAVTVVRWGVDDFVTQSDFEQRTFAVGDDIDMIGLFNRSPGVDKNSPILRRGTLAMLPDGPVQTRLGMADVYLVEAYSIGGMSGSPAIITAATIHPHPPSGARLRGIGRSALLGLVHGHWDNVDSDADGDAAQAEPKIVTNSGVSVIVPASKIIEVIEQDEITALKAAELPGLIAG